MGRVGGQCERKGKWSRGLAVRGGQLVERIVKPGDVEHQCQLLKRRSFWAGCSAVPYCAKSPSPSAGTRENLRSKHESKGYICQA